MKAVHPCSALHSPTNVSTTRRSPQERNEPRDAPGRGELSLQPAEAAMTEQQSLAIALLGWVLAVLTFVALITDSEVAPLLAFLAGSCFTHRLGWIHRGHRVTKISDGTYGNVKFTNCRIVERDS